jgi:hypothetical protein
MKTVIDHGGGLQSVIATEGGNLITGTVQDCDPILDDATARRNEGAHGSYDMRHAARFPAQAVEAYCNSKGIDFAAFMSDKSHIRAMLADPALAGFRIWDGKSKWH